MRFSLQQIEIPPGSRVLLHGIVWSEFEQTLAELGDNRGKKLAYDRGTLDIMSPSFELEHDKNIIGDLVKILLEELDIEFFNAGSTTFKNEKMAAGIEPDQCFYIRHEAQVRGKKRLVMGIDPPPDLALEIDITSHSHLRLYEILGVPELWRFDGEQLHIYLLEHGIYRESGESRQFPGWPLIEAIPRALQQSKKEGRNKAMRAFRAWVKTRLNAPP